MSGLSIGPHIARPGDETIHLLNLRLELLVIDLFSFAFSWRSFVLLAESAIFCVLFRNNLNFIEIFLEYFLIQQIRIQKFPCTIGILLLQFYQTFADCCKRSLQSNRTRRQKFTDDQNHQVTLPVRKRIGVITLQKTGNRFVQSLLIIGRCKRNRHQPASGITDKFHDIPSQRSAAESGEPFPQIVQISIDVGIQTSESRQVAEHLVVDQSGEPVEFRKRILQRCRRQKNLSSVLQSPADILPDSIALLMSVTQLMRFINHHKIPLDFSYLGRHFADVMIRGNDDTAVVKGIPVPLFLHLPPRFGIKDQRRQIKLLFQLDLPLFPQSCWTNYQEMPFPFRPVLTQN